MITDKNKIFELALKKANEEKLFHIEDVVAYLPISKSTFYEYFKLGSDELNAIKEILDKNKILVKQELKSKWFISENATLQIALFKMICTDEERKCLSQTYTDITSGSEPIENQKFVLEIHDYSNKTEK